MSPLLAVVLLSVLSALAYALAAVGQERLAADGRDRLAAWLRPGFLLAVALNAGGAGLHVLALRYGALAVVQPFSALTLVFALPLGAAVGGRRVTRREWRGAAETTAGLAGLLLVLDTGVPVETLQDGEVPRVAALFGAVLVSLALMPTRSVGARCLRLAAGGGVAFGVASVLAQTQVMRFAEAQWDGVVSVAVVGTAALVAAFAITGLLLAQAAYRCGLGAPLATLTVLNPVTAAAIGFILLGQGSGVGPVAAAAAISAAALAAHGVVLLAGRMPQGRDSSGT